MEKISGVAVAVGSVGKQRSAIRSKKSGFTNVTERVMKYIFTVCGITAVACVLMITIYMIISGAPAIGKIGLTDFLFGDTWYAKKEQFGILPLILTSVFGTLGAIVIGVPIGLLTAVFLSELAPKAMKNVVKPAVELLAGIPSVIYGLLGANLVKPLMYALEEIIYANDSRASVHRRRKPCKCHNRTCYNDTPHYHKHFGERNIRCPVRIQRGKLRTGSNEDTDYLQGSYPCRKSGIASGVVPRCRQSDR